MSIASCREWRLISLLWVWQVVFKPDVWPMFEPLLRADFTLFDTYDHDVNSTSHPPLYSYPSSYGSSAASAF